MLLSANPYPLSLLLSFLAGCTMLKVKNDTYASVLSGILLGISFLITGVTGFTLIPLILVFSLIAVPGKSRFIAVRALTVSVFLVTVWFAYSYAYYRSDSLMNIIDSDYFFHGDEWYKFPFGLVHYIISISSDLFPWSLLIPFSFRGLLNYGSKAFYNEKDRSEKAAYKYFLFVSFAGFCFIPVIRKYSIGNLFIVYPFLAILMGLIGSKLLIKPIKKLFGVPWHERPYFHK